MFAGNGAFIILCLVRVRTVIAIETKWQFIKFSYQS
jgi:hypothetical protein